MAMKNTVLCFAVSVVSMSVSCSDSGHVVGMTGGEEPRKEVRGAVQGEAPAKREVGEDRGLLASPEQGAWCPAPVAQRAPQEAARVVAHRAGPVRLGTGEAVVVAAPAERQREGRESVGQEREAVPGLPEGREDRRHAC